ncbi:pleckstrin (PH) domain-containing protein [Tieghemostelium lacteum]|uniref:Pleckstrin (PH) domain-containing protein n=1 Tax=Tieghemostelium lacteum TaxID=361077 RepID=A0A152A6S1_TIELA|nr:pleckstrin (PH) domain-containing protein [Tieghemostelium lacteum]|eukprot:KYR01923.1 pleckstrin (PH) domain-containing protein [Tieghemostelium lacteum]
MDDNKEFEDLLLSLTLAFIQRKKYSKLLKSESLRKDIIKEIWSTEKYYKEQLCTVIDLFFKPMLQMIKDSSDNSWGYKEVDVHSIFSHIENICSLSKLLFERLDPRIQSWEASSSIADIFVDLSPFFRCYKQFSENYSNSIQTLSRIKLQSPQFASWLRVREKDPRCKLLDLPSLLIAPIQKVPRYILLLDALAKATHPDHADQKRCIQASNLLKNVVQVVNDGINEDQNRKKLIALQSVFDNHIKFLGPLSYPTLVEPHRKLIKEGKLQKKSFRNQSLQSRMVYLCNDILITVTSLPVFIQSKSISKVDKIIPLVSASTVFDNEDDCSFYLISPIKTHQLVCESTQQRLQWMLDIQNAILSHVESNPSHKTQRAQWTVVHEDGIWKSISVDQPVSSNIKVSNSFEGDVNFYQKSPDSSQSYLRSSNNNNNQQVTTSFLLSTSPPPTYATSPKRFYSIPLNGSTGSAGQLSKSPNNEDKEWVPGVKKSSFSTTSSFFLGPKFELNSSNGAINTNTNNNNNNNNQNSTEDYNL